MQEVGIFLSLGVRNLELSDKFERSDYDCCSFPYVVLCCRSCCFQSNCKLSGITAGSANAKEEEKNNEGKVSTEYVAPKQDVQSISVEVTPEMYLLDGVSVLVLITASVLVSGIVILKRNPKRYFIGNELGGRRKC